MNAEEYQKVKELFQSAVEIEPEGRGAFLDEKCSGDGSVRGEVERLLGSYDSEYLEQPAVGEVAELLVPDGLGVGRQIGHYTILTSIGKGGMGEVYLAEDGKLGRQVALKVLPDDFAADGERLRRFEQEAQAASALNHPNILTIYEFAAEGKTHYLAAEYVSGQTLRQMMNGGALGVIESLDIISQIAAALDAAHRNGIIHRDIKPENIMLRDDGLVKVLDFGLAKFIDHALDADMASADSPTRKQLTTPGMIMGTVQYMSPEQTRGHATDARTDIWSFGVVLYEMLAGKPPFAGGNSADLIAEIVKTHPIPLSHFVTDVPERLEEIVTKTLEKNPDERYQSAKDLLIDLKRLKRKLELETEMQRSNQPLSDGTVRDPNSVATSKKKTREASSIQYIRAGVKLHRGTTFAIFGIIAALLLTSAYLARKYWRISDPNEARFAYATDIRLAAEALETSNLESAKKLLDATRPKKGEEDLRDFEWGYLARLHAERMASQPITLKNEGWVNSVAFSADGKTLATGSDNARLWDVSTGQQTAEFKGHTKGLVSVAISPDGTKLATGSFDKTAKLWDIPTGQILWTTIASTGTGLAVGGLVFSPDGNTLSGEDDDRKIMVWNVSTATETTPYLKFGKIGHQFAVSPDGKLLAAQTGAFFVTVFDIASGRKMLSIDAIGFVKEVVFAPDSKSLLIAGSEKIAKLWSLPSGKEVGTFKDVTGGLAFSPNGKTIAMCIKDTIKLWDVEKGYDIAILRGHANDVFTVAFSLDGLKLASGGFDNTAKIWNVPTAETRGILRGHTKAISNISFSPDSKLLASASEDKTARIWDVEMEQVRRPLGGHSDVVVFTAFSPDERTVATIAKDGMIKIWDIATGKQLLSFDSLNHGGDLFYSPNGKLIATANFWDGKDVSLWDAATGDLRCSFPIKSPWGVRFSKDGSRVTAPGDYKTVKLWDTANCAETWVFNIESEFNYLAVFTPDDRLIAFQIINSDRSLKMIDTESGKELATFSGHDEQLDFADISPNGKRLITYDKAGLIKVWDIANGQVLLTIKTGIKEIGSIALSPNGKIIATVSDGTIKLWRSDPLN